MSSNSAGFTLVELLVVLAILGLLAGLLLPALGRAKKSASRAACLSNLRQQGFAWHLYLADHEDRFPDRRDLKTSLPGRYRPWSDWPKSDPRTGWAAVVLELYLPGPNLWSCPALAGSDYAGAVQVQQAAGGTSQALMARYWMWRFDRPDEPVPPDNFWGRTPEAALAALQTANNPMAGHPVCFSDVELTVDVYFPATVAALPETLRGHTPHRRGRNRLMLDGSASFLRDARTWLE